MSALGVAALGVRGIRVAFGDAVALDDVTIEVPAGAVTAVVGGDGAGKSTLLRVLAGRVAAQRGSVRSLGKADVGYQPSSSGVWGGLTVDENVAFVAHAFGMPARTARTRGGKLLERAGLADARGRLGRDLSGGMRQKLGFLLAILHEPRLVLLDEPSTGVDPVSRVELWRLIAEAATADTAVLMATTYLDEAARAATVTALDRGRIIGAGTPDEIIAAVPGAIVAAPVDVAAPDSWRRGRVRHRWLASGRADAAGAGADASEADAEASAVAPGAGASGVAAPVDVDLEDALIALTLSREPDTPLVPAASFDLAGPTDASRPPRPEASVRGRPRTASVAGDLAGTGARDGADAAGAVVAEGRGLTRRFGAHVAVDDVSIAVSAGEIVGLIGANGAGKTTFLRCLIGLDRPDAGEALLFDAPPDAASRERLGYVPQSLGLYRTITVAANAEFFARVYGIPTPTLPPALAAVAGEPVAAIGLGRQRQLAFALALAHRPELLVLDEPTSGVDPLARARLWDTIHGQADAGVGVLVTTHYLQEAEQCTRLALLSQGRLVGVGSAAELTTGISAAQVRTDDWQRAFALLSAAGLPAMLSGRAIRVAGAAAEEVRAALGVLPAAVEDVAPTLEEAMVLRDA